MSEKKFYVNINLQDNEVNNLKADTLDITTNAASANTKRIVYWAGDYYYSDGTNWVQMSGGGGSVTNVTATTPLSSTGGTTPDISIDQADGTTDGYLSSTDWTTFNGKQNALGYTPVNLAGDTMLGNLILNADPTNPLGAVTKQYVDNNLIGLNFHSPVRVATAAPLPTVLYADGTDPLNPGVGATLTATANGALIIDGENFSLLPVPTIPYRVMIKDQVSGLENGIYTVTVAGDSLTPFRLTRATDADNSPTGELSYGDFCFVETGIVNGGLGYILNTVGTITVGVTPISYVIFNAAQVVTAGTGLLEATPNVLSVDITKVPYYSGGFSAGFAKWDGSNWIFDNSTYITSAALTPYLTSATAAATYYPIPTGTTSQYLRGDGTLATFPTIPSITPAALTKVDDTNVTLSLGGSPSNALLQGVSLTLGWTGTLADSRIASAATWNAKFTLPALTSGSVLFSDGTTITQDNANFFWDDTNNRLGIGTTTPGQSLDVRGNTLIRDNSGITPLNYDLEVHKTVNGEVSAWIRNNSSGNAAFAQVGTRVDSSTQFKMGIYSSGFTTSGLITAGTAYLLSAGTNASKILIGNQTASKDIIFVNGGTVAANEIFRISSTNTIDIYDARNLTFGTTTGTKFGTATSQKIGFFNATPVPQQGAVTTAQGIADALTTLGFLAAGSVVSSGGGGFTVTTQSGASYSANNGDYVLINAATHILTLPAVSANARVGVKMIVAPASLTSIQIKTAGAGITIDGVDRSGTGLRLFNQYDAYIFISDGFNWFIES